MNLLFALLVGLLIGLLARALYPGAQRFGWFSTILIGLLGSALGRLLCWVLGISGGPGLLGSIIGALLLIWVLARIAEIPPDEDQRERTEDEE